MSEDNILVLNKLLYSDDEAEGAGFSAQKSAAEPIDLAHQCCTRRIQQLEMELSKEQLKRMDAEWRGDVWRQRARSLSDQLQTNGIQPIKFEPIRINGSIVVPGMNGRATPKRGRRMPTGNPSGTPSAVPQGGNVQLEATVKTEPIQD